MKELATGHWAFLLVCKCWHVAGMITPTTKSLKKHFEKFLDCWRHLIVEIEVCLILHSTVKAVISTVRVFPCSEELWGIGILLFCHHCNVLRHWLIVILNHAWKILWISVASLLVIATDLEPVWF